MSDHVEKENPGKCQKITIEELQAPPKLSRGRYSHVAALAAELHRRKGRRPIESG